MVKLEGMALTTDDSKLLTYLYRYRYLNTQQIFKLFPIRSKEGLRRRLRKLRKQNLVKGLDQSLRRDITSHNAFCLARDGLDFVASEMGVSPDELYTTHRGSRVKSLYLNHYTNCNDVRITVERCLENHTDLKLIRWISEYTQRINSVAGSSREERYLIKRKFTHQHQKITWEPDALFIVSRKNRQNSNQILFCLEVDRGTEPLSTIQNKMLGYKLFLKAGGLTGFGAKALVLLWVCESGRRLNNMRVALQDGLRATRFGLMSDLEGESFFDKPVWLNLNSEWEQLYSNS